MLNLTIRSSLPTYTFDSSVLFPTIQPTKPIFSLALGSVRSFLSVRVQPRSCADETINNRVRLSLDWCLVLVWAHRPCHYLSMAKYGAWFPERSIMKRINIGE